AAHPASGGARRDRAADARGPRGPRHGGGSRPSARGGGDARALPAQQPPHRRQAAGPCGDPPGGRSVGARHRLARLHAGSRSPRGGAHVGRGFPRGAARRAAARRDRRRCRRSRTRGPSLGARRAGPPSRGGLRMIGVLVRWGRLVRASHTIFSLPFAVAAAAVAAASHPIGLRTAALILVCVVAARTAAMAYNRIADREIDARNPRTAAREIPAGKVRVREAWALTILSGAVFLVAAFLLSPL